MSFKTNANSKSLREFKLWLDKFQRWALILGEDSSPEESFAAAALYLWLKNLGKGAGIVSGAPLDFSIREFGILPISVLSGLNLTRLVIDIKRSNILSDDITVKKLESGIEIAAPLPIDFNIMESISVGTREEASDCAVILGSLGPDDMKGFYYDQIELFENTPKIGLSKFWSGEFFTQLQIIVPTASCLSEIVIELVRETAPDALSEDAATLLYAGISFGTRNFQSGLATSRTFQLASWLLEKGARQEQVSMYLYPKLPLDVLKFFGNVLEVLEVLPRFPAGLAILDEPISFEISMLGRTIWDVQNWLGGNYRIVLMIPTKDNNYIVATNIDESFDSVAFEDVLELNSPARSFVGPIQILTGVANLSQNEIRHKAEDSLMKGFGMV